MGQADGVAENLGWWVPVVVVVVPPSFLLGMQLLAWVESWMLRPDERAAAIHQLLDEAHSAEQLEVEVARLLEEVPVARRRAGRGARRETTDRSLALRRLRGRRRAATVKVALAAPDDEAGPVEQPEKSAPATG